MDVIVIGAGVGGLAAARRLLADGHTVRVFEKAPGRRTGGAALTIFGNGAAVLSDLGIDLDGVGGRIDRIDARTADGRLRTTMDLAHAADAYGFPTRSISRRQIVDLLSDGLPDGLVRYGTGCARVTQDAGSATAVFEDGSTATGDVVVGADGVNSVVRRQLWGEGTVRPASFGTWQGLSPIDIDITDTTLHYMITGKEGACGLIPAGPGLLQWWFDVRWKPADPRPDDPVEMLRRRFGHWAYPVPEVLAAATADDLDFFGHRWNKVRRVWGEGRVTLLGDSAHTMPPTLGQGANQTFEDAWVLGRELADAPGGDGRSVPERLRAYERARYPHVNLVSQMAKRNPANWRIPPALGKRISETAQTKLLARFSNRLTEGPLPTGEPAPPAAANA